MKMDNIIAVAWVVAGWLFVLSGCTRMPLYEATSRIELLVDWKLEPSHSVPPCNQVQVMFYHRETHELMFTYVLPAKGGEIVLPPGLYDMVLYGVGTERTQIRSLKKYQWIEAYTENTDRPSVFDGQDVLYSPDHLYVARRRDLEISSMRAMDQVQKIRVEASSIVEEYSLEVAITEGAEYIDRVEAYISGQARSNYFARPELRAEAVSLYLDMNFLPKENLLQSTFETFGKLPGEQSEVFLRVSIINIDGTTQDHIYDITDEFEQDDNQLLIDDSIVVDIPKIDNDAMVPIPNPWNEEVIVIPL